MRARVLLFVSLVLACDRADPVPSPSPPASTAAIAVPIASSPTVADSTSASAAPALPPLPDALLASPPRDDAPPIRIDPEAATACPPNMLLVSGEYCPGLAQPCLRWVKGGVMRCAQFAPSTCIGKREQRRFCIDRYEYPNLAGVKPVVMVSWYDALRACELEGKRLCLVSEWNLACEGAERLPYPYGHKRDKRVCNFERPRPQPEPRFNLFDKPRLVGAEVERLDLRVESGRLEGCVSPFGVHDMTGNVDEWTLNEDHFDLPETEDKNPPYISGLKGGYWGPIRAACRPITPTHVERFRFYQVGFRCCANAKDRPDGVADRYTSRLKKWRQTAGLPEHPPPPHQ